MGEAAQPRQEPKRLRLRATQHQKRTNKVHKQTTANTHILTNYSAPNHESKLFVFVAGKPPSWAVNQELVHVHCVVLDMLAGAAPQTPTNECSGLQNVGRQIMSTAISSSLSLLDLQWQVYSWLSFRCSNNCFLRAPLRRFQAVEQ